MEKKRYFLRHHNDNYGRPNRKKKDNILLSEQKILSKKSIENSLFSNNFNYKNHLSSFDELDTNIKANFLLNQKVANTSENFKSLNIIEKFKIIMKENKFSEIYQKKARHIFETFINYIIDNTKNKQIKSPNKKFSPIEFKRIKIKDIFDFVQNNRRYKSLKTKYNVLSFLRRITRSINEEPKLNFKNKIIPPKDNKKSQDFNNDVLNKIALNFREEKDLENLSLFYLLYFCGLNFYMISRIMIKDLKSSFNTLIIKKGGKKRVHTFPKIIVNLLFEYFTSSRTYVSKYFFFDNFIGKNGISRVKYIQNKFKEALMKQKIASFKEIEKIISSFSKLRRAVIFSEQKYYLFDLSLSRMLNNKIFNEDEYYSKEIQNESKGKRNTEEKKDVFIDEISDISIPDNKEENILKKKFNFDLYLTENIIDFGENDKSLSFSFISDV